MITKFILNNLFKINDLLFKNVLKYQFKLQIMVNLLKPGRFQNLFKRLLYKRSLLEVLS